MKQPTHFIEVIKFIDTDTIINNGVMPIDYVDINLELTKISPIFKTIAVWKIYPKPQAYRVLPKGGHNSTKF